MLSGQVKKLGQSRITGTVACIKWRLSQMKKRMIDI